MDLGLACSPAVCAVPGKAKNMTRQAIAAVKKSRSFNLLNEDKLRPQAEYIICLDYPVSIFGAAHVG
jgi:hypothetical protein